MIVEFVGTTGAGKTTLARRVRGKLSEQARVTTFFDLVADPLGLHRATNITIRNLIQDVSGFPFFIGSLHQHRAFVEFALRNFARQNSTFFTLNYVRSIARRIGMYEIARRHGHDRVILADEGTVLAAHLLFAFSNQEYSQDDIKKFASLVPLPDLVVYVKAPVDTLVRCSLQRGDAPKEIRSKNHMLTEKYARRASGMFDRLIETSQIQNRVLIVENPESTEEQRSAVAGQIAAFIMNYELGTDRSFTLPAGRVEPVSVIGETHVS